MAATVPIYYLCKLECVVGEGQYIILEKQYVNYDQPIRFGTDELYDFEYNDTTLIGQVIGMGRNAEKLQSQMQKLLRGEEMSQTVCNTQSSQFQPKSQTSYSQVATTSTSRKNSTHVKPKTTSDLVKSKTKKESDSVFSEWSNSQEVEHENSQGLENNDDVQDSPSSPQSPSLFNGVQLDSPLRRPQRKRTTRFDPSVLGNDNGGGSETEWEPTPEKTSIFKKKTVYKKKSSTGREISMNLLNRASTSLASGSTSQNNRSKIVKGSSFSQGSGNDANASLKRKIAVLEAENSTLKNKRATVPVVETIRVPTSHVLVEDDDEDDLNNDIKVLGTYQDSDEETQVVQVDRFQYGLINFREPIGAVKKLSVMVFTPEVLATHTYTGKKSNAHLKCYEDGSKAVKGQLCPHLLGIVVDHTLRRFKKLQKDGMFREKKTGNTRQLLVTDLITSIQVKCACLAASGRY